MGRFGQMILDGGVYNGKQIVPKDYVELCWTPQVDVSVMGPTVGLEGKYMYSHAFFSPEANTILANGYEDLGPEAIFRLELRDFPAVVALDCQGRDQYKLGPQEYVTAVKKNV